MKAIVDKSLCTGCGLCADACPEIFQIGGEGLAEVLKESSCSSCDLEEVEDICPVDAISIAGAR